MNEEASHRFSFNREQLQRAVFFVSFGVLCFLFFTYLTFPYQKVANVLIAKLEARTPYEIQITDVDPYLFPGISLEGVTVYSRSGAGSPPDEAKRKRRIPLLEVDRLRLRLKLFSLLRGGIGIAFCSRFASGEFRGSYFRSSGRFAFRSKWRDIQLSGFNFLKEHGIGLLGSLSGGADVEGNPTDIRTGKGSISFQVDGGGLQNTTLMKVITLPDMGFDRFGGKFVLKEGKLHFDQVEMKGNDLQAEFTGEVNLRKPVRNSILSLNLRFKPSSEVDDQIGYLFTTAMMRKDRQGFYTRRVSGTLGSPR